MHFQVGRKELGLLFESFRAEEYEPIQIVLYTSTSIFQILSLAYQIMCLHERCACMCTVVV